MARGIKIFLFSVLIIIAIEIILRVGFGFCDTVLVMADEKFEYVAQPSQERRRFGNDIFYNDYSMRSDNVIPDAIKILGLGDSVINGGTLTNQKDLATSLLTENLTDEFDKNIQVLNIAYASWGPDNAFAYLNKYGDFQADVLFLVVSSHDAVDNMEFENIVGKHKSYPEEQYSVAYFEIIDRYLIPKFKKYLKSERSMAGVLGVHKNQTDFNTGFQDILDFTRNKNIPFLIYLHPEISEVNKGRYNRQGQLIIEFADINGIELLQGLHSANENQYRDNIHLNRKGQKHLSNILLPVLKCHIKSGNPVL